MGGRFDRSSGAGAGWRRGGVALLVGAVTAATAMAASSPALGTASAPLPGIDAPVVADTPVVAGRPVVADTPVVAGRPLVADTTTVTDTTVTDALGIAGASGAADAGATDAGAALASARAPLAAAIVGLERRLAEDVVADGVGSIAAAVVVGDSVVWQAAFGRADRETGALAAPTTIYRAGSISKSVTALVLLALVEQGVVGLDDAVEPHLPELRGLASRDPSHRAITFRDLAAHTAGLAREPATSHAARGPIRHWRRSLLAAIPATEARMAPGTGYHYSNIGYALLGLALERAAGRPFESLVQELVFDPLGMASSHFVVPRRDLRRLAAGYVNPAAGPAAGPGPDSAPDAIDPRVPRAEHRGRGYKVPNGGVYSTVGDLGRLIMAMTGALGDTPISAASRAAALADQMAGVDPAPDGLPGRPADRAIDAADRTGPADRVGYGLGFQLHRIGDTVIAGHSGSVAGYTAYLAFDPATRTGVVLLRNYNSGASNLGVLAVRALMELGG